VIIVSLLALYHYNRRRYTLLRNAMIVSGALGLVFFAFFPVAPPRFFGGFTDTVAELSTSYKYLQPPSIVNKYAALPSFHVGWNVLACVVVFRSTRSIPVRVFAVASPLLVSAAVVLTGNHWVIDGLVGEEATMAGMTCDAYVGYAVGGALTRLTFNTLGPSQTDADGTPAQLAIAEAAGDGCPANTRMVAGEMIDGKDVCLLTGTIVSHTHLTSHFAYVLDGKVSIGANDVTPVADKVKLTIDAGTTVYAQQGGNHYLLIDRGGQLHANGSREKPVIFTYVDQADATSATRGQWGGLVLNGAAPTNVPGNAPSGEGGSGIYGGDNPEDSSGVLTFVQVKYAGFNFNEEDELNGIAFQATGSGTLVDYIQVHNNADDGVEWFGGTTSAKHLLLTGNEDDALDWTEGWNGKLQFVAMRQSSDSDHCIEADSNGDNNDLEPRARAVISNITCHAPGGADKSGFRLREGTSAVLSNVAMGNFPNYCVDIDQAATFNAAGGSIAGLNGSLALTNSRVDAQCGFSQDDDDLFNVRDWFDAKAGSMMGGVDLGGGSGLINGHELNDVAPTIPDDPFFEQVDYIGAIKDETSDWTAGWSFSDWD